MATTFENSLKNAHHPKWLFMSLWMYDPEQHKDYHKFAFRQCRLPLWITNEMPPIPVFTDPCTDRFLVGKDVRFEWEPYVHEATGERRARITHVVVSPVEKAVADLVDEDWPSFRQKFLEWHRKKPGDADSSDDDDDVPPAETLEQFATRHGVVVDTDSDAQMAGEDEGNEADDDEVERPRSKRR